MSHDHRFLSSSHDDNARRTRAVMWLTLLAMFGEIVMGYVTGSMALLADGFHMATHAGALGISAAAYGYARRHSDDPGFSFGTGKVGELAGFASALVLMLVAVGIAGESLVRLVNPTQVAFDTAMAIAAVGLLVNIASALMLGHGDAHHDHDHDHDHDHGHTAHAHHDSNLRSAYVHVLADALTSVLAIVALLAGRFLGWVWLDPAMGVVGALVILRWGWSLLRASAQVLLDRTEAQVAEHLRREVQALPGAQLADLHVWRVGPQACAAIVSVVGPVEPVRLRSRLEQVGQVRHLTLEVLQAAR
ncbi:CDF family Co(II)/Ni(II) efflux transporter DmeF [Pseudomonas typographi]|uniref:CDF family Co(II)/Ni(II) efflux transporter DmeF n=1 Tax=Pseudomonas typographi TaxID=2715964 RepID=UPI001689B2E4|nr:CDF family Co(II)/Ni(II) efflux transporter DmeF [Pseudomonas typographi]MBD1551762.1 CDF family Co(II)/Ni(II) efflux transporter DmeF [Pseudomonas typographi]